MDLIVKREGLAGRLTLNRPKALNALTEAMVSEIRAALEAWRHDDAVKLVILDAEGDKAFCAGGDIRALYDSGRAGNFAHGPAFWAEEYRLNAAMGAYSKPIVSFMQGFVMGGGVGVGCHVAHRVVDEGSKVAMPECNIGLIPDVGGTHLLAHMPGHLGEYFGLTAARMRGAEAVEAGFADHLIARDAWEGIKSDLCQTGDVAILAQQAQDTGGALAALQAQMDPICGKDNLAEIMDAAQGTDVAAALNGPSPLSMLATLALVRAARAEPGLEAALEREFRFTARSLEQSDFLEGIRAAVIDKDGAPNWKHAGIAEVPPEEVAAILAPLPGGVTVFPDPMFGGET